MSELHFLRPWWLLALLPWAWLLWHLWRRRGTAGDWARVCEPQLLKALLAPAGTQSSRWPGRLLALSGCLAIGALAGPTWQRLPTPVYQTDAALVVLFDLSRSMDAPDLAPDRLTRARFKLADLLRQRHDGLAGLVVFAGEAFLAAPLSDDNATLLHLLDGLESRLMPTHGSRLLPALELADELFAGAGIARGDLLLISDGEGLEAQAEAALRARPHRLFVLGVGTAEGAPIPQGEGFFKDAEGNIVVPRLDETRLRSLAEAGRGAYLRLRADDADIRALLQAMQPLAPQGRLAEDSETEQWRDMGAWLLLPLLPLAALGFRRGYLVLLLLPLLLLPVPRAEAVDLESWWFNQGQRAHQRMQDGDYATAAEQFTDPRWRAAALYRQGQYEAAVQALEGLDQADDWYNRGNALAGQQDFRAAIDAYQQALQRQPDHADAAHNLAELEALLREQQQQGEQPGEDGRRDDPEGQDQRGENQQAEGEGERSGQGDEESQDEPGEQQQPGEGEKQADSQSGDQSQPGEAGEQASPQSAEQSGEGESGAAVSRNSGDQEADEQWLRRIQEDPAELLRRKFQYLSRQRGGQTDEERPW